MHWDRVQHEDVGRLGKTFASLRRPPLRLPSCLGYRPATHKKKNTNKKGPDDEQDPTSMVEVQEECAEAFRLVDETGRGALTHRGVLTALRALNCHPTNSPASDVSVDSAEFVKMAAALYNNSATVGSKESFDALDVNGDGGEAQDGFLSATQIRKWVGTLTLEPKLTDDEVDIIVKEGQAGGDGQVDFEWCQYGLRLIRDIRRYQELFVRNYDVIVDSEATAKPAWKDPEDEHELRMLEARVDPKYLMLTRTFVQKKKETEAAAADRGTTKKKAKKKQKKSSWFSSDADSSGKKDAHALTEKEEDDLRRAIMATVDDTPIEGDETFVSHDIQLKFSISVTLSSGEDVARIHLPSASGAVKLYPFDEKKEVTMEMDCITIDDCRLPASSPACYRRIVGPMAPADKSSTVQPHGQRFLRLAYTALPQQKMQLVDLTVETPLLYVHSPGVLNAVKEIFATPAAVEDLPESLTEDIQAAQMAMREFSARRKAQLKRRLAERDKVTLTAHIATPVILVPANRHARDSPCLAFSLGTLEVDGGQIEASEEVDMRRTWRPVEKTFSSDQHEVTERQTDVIITEQIGLDVKGMQVMLMPSAVDDWAAALAQEDDKDRLLQRVDLNLRAYMGNEPFQRLVVQCELGEFGIAVSRQQTNNLVCIKNALSSQTKQRPANEHTRASQATAAITQDSRPIQHGQAGASGPSDFTRFVQFDCPALSVKIRADDGLTTLAALSIRRPKVGVALSPDRKDCGFTLQGIGADGVDEGDSEKVTYVTFLETPVQSTVDDLIRVYFSESPARREVDVKMENIDMTWHPQSVASIRNGFVDGLAQAPAPTKTAPTKTAPTKTAYQARLAKLKTGYRSAAKTAATPDTAVAHKRLICVKAGLQRFTITLARDCKPLYEFKMTSADVSFNAGPTDQRHATLNLRNLQVLHRASTNFPELVGLDQSSEGESLVAIEYKKNPSRADDEGTPPESYDSLLTLKLCPLKIHAVMACAKDLTGYVGESLESLKHKPNTAAAATRTPAVSTAKQTRDIIRLMIQSPTLLVANGPDSYEWHEVKPGDLSVVKDGADLTVQMVPDADSGVCTASVKTVGDFKGSSMELFRMDINEVKFCLTKGVQRDKPLLHVEFNLTGQFWNLRHSCWEKMLVMEDLLLEVAEQKPPLLGWKVRFEPLKTNGVVHQASLTASGALVYSGIQYLKCRNSRRAQADVGEAEHTGVHEGQPVRDQARIINRTGTKMLFSVNHGAVDDLDPLTATAIPVGGEAALSTYYTSEAHDEPFVLAVQLDGWSMCTIALNQCGDFGRNIRQECARESTETPWLETAVCVFSITLIDGAMVVTCRSTLVVCNASAIDLSIKLVDRRAESEPLQVRGTDWSTANGDGRPVLGYVAVDSAHCEDLRIMVSTPRDEASVAADGWSDKPLVVPVPTGASPRAFARKFQPVECTDRDGRTYHFMCEVVTTAESRRVTISAPFAVENLLPSFCRLATSLKGSAVKDILNWNVAAGKTHRRHRYSAKSIEDADAIVVAMDIDGFERAQANVPFSGSTELKLRAKQNQKQELPVKLQLVVSKDNAVTLRIFTELLLVNRISDVQVTAKSARWDGSWAQNSAVLTLPQVKSEALVLQCSTADGSSTFACRLPNGSDFTGYEQLDVPGTGTQSHCVTVNCQFGPGSLDDTKVITVFPRYAVINKLDTAVRFRAQSPDGLTWVDEIEVRPDEGYDDGILQIHTLQTGTPPAQLVSSSNGDGYVDIEQTFLVGKVTIDGWAWPSDLDVNMSHVESHFTELIGPEGQSRFVQIQVRRSTTEAEFVMEIKPAAEEIAKDHVSSSSLHVKLLSKNHPSECANCAAEPRNGLTLQQAISWCESLPDCHGMWFYDNGRCCPKASWTEGSFTMELPGGNFYQIRLLEPQSEEPQPEPETEPTSDPEHAAGSAPADADPAKQNHVHIEMPNLNISFNAFDHPGSIHDSRLAEDDIRELQGEGLFSITLDHLTVDLVADSGLAKKTTMDVSVHDIRLASMHDSFDGTETESHIHSYTRTGKWEGGVDVRPLFQCEKCNKNQRVGLSAGIGAGLNFISKGHGHIVCSEEGCRGKLWDPLVLARRRNARDEKHDLAKLHVEISNHGDLKIFEEVDVRLQRDIGAEVTDMFLLKIMELSKNLTRFQTGLSPPPFKPWVVMEYWQAGQRLTISSASEMGSFRMPAAGPDERAAGSMLFRHVHISVLNAHVTFMRASDRGPHLFKIPMYGPIPKGFSAQLQSLGFAEQHYSGILGSVGSLVRVIKASYIYNAKSVVLSRLTPRLLAGATSTMASDTVVSQAKSLLNVDTTSGGSIDRMNFEKRTMNNKQIFAHHFNQAMTIQSAEALLEQAQHMAFDWAYNHQGGAARTCIVVTVLNRSARPLAVKQAEGTLLTGIGAGCEVSNTELVPCRSAGDWDAAQCAMVFAYGAKLDVKCTLRTTAFDVECGVSDGIDQSKFHTAAGFHVTIEYEESTKWWALYSISVMDDMSVEQRPTDVTVYENQRRIAVFGIGGDWSAKSLLPTDRGNWSDEEGTVEYSGTDDPALLPRGTEWAPGSSWQAEAWRYGKLPHSAHPAQRVCLAS